MSNSSKSLAALPPDPATKSFATLSAWEAGGPTCSSQQETGSVAKGSSCLQLRALLFAVYQDRHSPELLDPVKQSTSDHGFGSFWGEMIVSNGL